MKGLWDGMGKTTEGFPPMSFLQVSSNETPIEYGSSMMELLAAASRSSTVEKPRSFAELTSLAFRSPSRYTDPQDRCSSVWRAVSTGWLRSTRYVHALHPSFIPSTSRTRTRPHRTTDLPSSFLSPDADECWTTMTNALQALPGVGSSNGNFVSQFMMGEMVKE